MCLLFVTLLSAHVSIDPLDLAHDILFELVPDDETEQEYLDLVRD